MVSLAESVGWFAVSSVGWASEGVVVSVGSAGCPSREGSSASGPASDPRSACGRLGPTIGKPAGLSTMGAVLEAEPSGLTIGSDGTSVDDSLFGLPIRSPTETPRSTRNRTGSSGSASSAVAMADDIASSAPATATDRWATRRGWVADRAPGSIRGGAESGASRLSSRQVSRAEASAASVREAGS